MSQLPNNKKRLIIHLSRLLSITYITVIIALAYTNDLFKDLFNNTVWFELSFTLFIIYLILYIKDAFITDFIEIVIEKEEKAFLTHFIEHIIEPFILFLFFLGATRVLLLLNMNSALPKIFVIVGTPLLYYIIKKKAYIVKKNGTL